MSHVCVNKHKRAGLEEGLQESKAKEKTQDQDAESNWVLRSRLGASLPLIPDTHYGHLVSDLTIILGMEMMAKSHFLYFFTFYCLFKTICLFYLKSEIQRIGEIE